MIPINRIRDNKEEILKRLEVKNFKSFQLIDDLLLKDDSRKTTQKKLDDILSESKKISGKIAICFKNGERDKAEELKGKSSEYKSQSQELTKSLREIEEEIIDISSQIPNIPHESVPSGNSDSDNEIIREHGSKPSLDDNALPHWELCKKYNIIDFDLGTKLTGAGFPVYRGKGAKLERALINFFLDNAIEAGYEEVIPPLMVNEDSCFATGQLPDKEGQMYQNKDGFYMISTAEIPVTNIYRNEIVKSDNLPIKHTAFSQCFRREAGSYGKDVRGLNRLHQFDKVELVQICKPQDSYAILETMASYVEGILQKLELPYRVLRLCGGDTSFASALTYDFETYSTAQERWLEVSSVSNFEDFQSNRLKTRYKNEEGKTTLCHTLNGSALALPRIVATLLENNQTDKGIKIPETLVQYTGFEYLD